MTTEPDIDARTSLFAEACWQVIRGQRAKVPTAEEFGIHPFIAYNVASLIGIKATAFNRRHVKQPKQEQLSLETKTARLSTGCNNK